MSQPSSPQLVSQSLIKTQCIVPKIAILPWIRSRFPELGEDAKLTGIGYHYQDGADSYAFTIEHTIQLPKPAGPILLSVPNGDAADGDVEER